MATRSYIDWNGLTVSDIRRIITHFELAEHRYLTEQQACTEAVLPKYFGVSLARVRERQRFWTAMIPCVERGEKIALKVREEISYCRSQPEYS